MSTLQCDPNFPGFHEVQHPLLQHKLSTLRDKQTRSKDFRELLTEISLMLTYTATQHLPVTLKTIHTPLEVFDGHTCIGKNIVVVPILRAGIGMLDGFLTLIPTALVGSIGLVRQKESLEPVCYLFKIPAASQDKHFFICDPTLATGGSINETIVRLKAAGVKKITVICILAAPEGVARITKAHPDVFIYAAKLDRQLNDHGYILPGLGDAGDRLFGTV
jgi:uracil phosphoribosyltransferase